MGDRRGFRNYAGPRREDDPASEDLGTFLPEGVVYIGAEGPQVWSWSSDLFALVLVFALSIPFSDRSKLSPDERARLSPAIWVVALAEPLYWGVLWRIFFGAPQFYHNLFDSRSAFAT